MDLKNKWMNSVDFLASMAHWEGSALIVICSWLFWHQPGRLAASIAILVAAAIKEYWYDANYEIPTQTWKDNTLDFVMYLVGVLGANTLIHLL